MSFSPSASSAKQQSSRDSNGHKSVRSKETKQPSLGLVATRKILKPQIISNKHRASSDPQLPDTDVHGMVLKRATSWDRAVPGRRKGNAFWNDDEEDFFLSEPSLSEREDSEGGDFNSIGSLLALNQSASFDESEHSYDAEENGKAGAKERNRLSLLENEEVSSSPGNTSLSSKESPHIRRKFHMQFGPVTADSNASRLFMKGKVWNQGMLVAPPQGVETNSNADLSEEVVGPCESQSNLHVTSNSTDAPRGEELNSSSPEKNATRTLGDLSSPETAMFVNLSSPDTEKYLTSESDTPGKHKDKSTDETGKPALSTKYQAAEYFLQKLKQESEGAVEMAGAGSFSSFALGSTSEGTDDIDHRTPVLPRAGLPSPVHQRKGNPDETLDMVFSSSDDESVHINDVETRNEAMKEDQHSADDEKTAENPRRKRASPPRIKMPYKGDRRSRNASGTTDALLAVGAEWIRMGQDQQSSELPTRGEQTDNMNENEFVSEDTKLTDNDTEPISSHRAGIFAVGTGGLKRTQSRRRRWRMRPDEAEIDINDSFYVSDNTDSRDESHTSKRVDSNIHRGGVHRRHTYTPADAPNLQSHMLSTRSSLTDSFSTLEYLSEERWKGHRSSEVPSDSDDEKKASQYGQASYFSPPVNPDSFLHKSQVRKDSPMSANSMEYFRDQESSRLSWISQNSAWRMQGDSPASVIYHKKDSSRYPEESTDEEASRPGIGDKFNFKDDTNQDVGLRSDNRMSPGRNPSPKDIYKNEGDRGEEEEDEAQATFLRAQAHKVMRDRGTFTSMEMDGPAAPYRNNSYMTAGSASIHSSNNNIPTFVCPRCKMTQRAFFTVSTAPQMFESPANYLALYFAIYVVASLCIFGLEEGWPALDCVYFSVITLTTAGLGDFVPSTDGAKVICSIFIYFGVACIGLFLGSLLASGLDEESRKKSKENQVNNCISCSRVNSVPRRIQTPSKTVPRYRMSERVSPSVSTRAQSRRSAIFTSERVPRATPRTEEEDAQAIYEGGDTKRYKRDHMVGRGLTSVSEVTEENSKTGEKIGPPADSTPNITNKSPATVGSANSSNSAGRIPTPPMSSPFFRTRHTPPKSPVVPSPFHFGSPRTASILNRQNHTRHGSFLPGNVIQDSTRSRIFSAEEFGRAHAPQVASEPTYVAPGVEYEEEEEADSGTESDDEGSETEESSDFSQASDPFKPMSRVQTAKYVFLTLKQAISNSLLIIAIGSFGFYFIEKLSAVDSFYFTTVLLTTVGYGDIAPVTAGGKLFATVYVLVAGTTLLHNMSLISMIPLELRKRRIERAVLMQFGEHLDDHALKELATGPLIRNLQLSSGGTNGLDECTREMFALAMLVRLGRITEHDLRLTFAAFRRLDHDNDGKLNSKDIIIGEVERRRMMNRKSLLSTQSPASNSSLLGSWFRKSNNRTKYVGGASFRSQQTPNLEVKFPDVPGTNQEQQSLLHHNQQEVLGTVGGTYMSVRQQYDFCQQNQNVDLETGYDGVGEYQSWAYEPRHGRSSSSIGSGSLSELF